jgi:micrococcal nuclease
VEPYGHEASERNRQLVEGKTVYLEKDVSETDRYGRLLRYVYVGDTMVKAVLVQEGYAQDATFPPDVRHAEEFLKLEREARDEGRGLWAADTTEVRQQDGTSLVEASVESEDGDPAYPSVCIPPPPPDLDCGDITYRRFEVLAPDPHRFDGDKDGVGCQG